MNTSKGQGKVLKTGKAKNMTKTTLMTVAELLNSLTAPTTEQIAARDAVNAEVAKNEAKAQANRELYESAKPIVLAVIDSNPKTVSEIYDACKVDLPADFSKSKVQYALQGMWLADVNKGTNSKGVNVYSR